MHLTVILLMLGKVLDRYYLEQTSMWLPTEEYKTGVNMQELIGIVIIFLIKK